VTSAAGSEYTIHVNYLIDYKDRVLHLRRGLQRPQSPRSQVSIVSAPSFAGSPHGFSWTRFGRDELAARSREKLSQQDAAFPSGLSLSTGGSDLPSSPSTGRWRSACGGCPSSG